MDARRGRLRLFALLALAAALALAGCGGGDDPDSTSAGTTGASGVSGATGASGPSGAGDVPIDGPPDPSLTVLEVSEQLPLPAPVVDDEGFKQTLDILIAASHKFWSEALDEVDVPYHLPDEFIAYDGKAGDQGPDCGGEPAGAQNAAYCRVPGESEYGIITWDESGLIYPYFKKLGDGSTAFIIGHEFSHLVQDRLGIIQKFPLTIEKELNADCLTGAYLGGFDAKVSFTRTDLQSMMNGIAALGDQPGVPWGDHAAHGTAEERQDAFFQGFEQGAKHCINTFAPGFSGG